MNERSQGLSFAKIHVPAHVDKLVLKLGISGTLECLRILRSMSRRRLLWGPQFYPTPIVVGY